MGLDISCSGQSFRAGSYSGFNQFRSWLVQQLEYENLDEYWKKTDIQKEELGKWISKSGTYQKAHHFRCGPLLQHSDCEGYITPQKAISLLQDLNHVKTNLKTITKSNYPKNEEIWFREKLNDWINICQTSIATRENINFH